MSHFSLDLTNPKPTRQRVFSLFRRFAGFVLLLSILGGVSAQVPTPAQLELLNALPPAQRTAILRELRNFQRDQAQGADTAAIEAELIDELDLEDEGLATEEQLEPLEPPRLEPGGTIVIEFLVSPQAPPASLASADQMRQRLLEGNPYVLDDLGNIYLPGVPTIALAGLTADEASIRLEADVSLVSFDMFVTHLPLEPVGVEGLEPFGYGIFERRQGRGQAFAPATDIPVPAEYLIGPGDNLNVQLFGNVNDEYFLPVSRDGTISFPEIGPIGVAGLDFPSAREVINQRIAEQMIGVRPSITLGELRTIRVFVLGDVEEPGSYAVTGLSTMTNALMQSGAVTEIGSLRNIQLKRSGETITTLDLYELLLNGDTSSDARLQPGDVILVPPVGDTIAVGGAVKRPAIYELQGGETIGDSIELAGGLAPDADASRIKLERIVPGRGVTVEELDLSVSDNAGVSARDGDVVNVPPNLDLLENVVRLEGNVHQPGRYQWTPGMRLTDLLPSPELLKPMSDPGYVLIRREIAPNVLIEAVSADLRAALAARGGPDDPLLQSRDTVYVFNLEIGRQHILTPLVNELRAQVPAVQVVAVVSIGGSVRAPGEYPLEPRMTVSDLIRAGGGLMESAYTIDAELTRYDVLNGEYRETALLAVDLAGVLTGQPGADIVLSAHDYLNIRETPRWGQQESVELRGEVLFPGSYPIRQGETLASVLQRAGGLTELAFPEGTIFLRAELREREREQLDILADRIQGDLTALSLSDPGATQAMSIGQSLITQLSNAQPVGRMVVSLDRIAAGDVTQNIILKNRDRILVPGQTQAVTVLGEVQYATSHLFESGLTRDDYLQRSGGPTVNADDKRIYVVRANGQVEIEQSSRWFRRANIGSIRAGDTIVVPLDTDRVRPLVFWTSATSVIYNLAIAVAAISGL